MLKMMKLSGKTIRDFLSIHMATSCGVMVVHLWGSGELLSGGILIEVTSFSIKSSWLWVVIVGTFKLLGKLYKAKITKWRRRFVRRTCTVK